MIVSTPYAARIVGASINKVSGAQREIGARSVKLIDLGVSQHLVEPLIRTIVFDRNVGLLSLSLRVDSAGLFDVNSTTTIGELIDQVAQLSAQKLCSNPTNPHPQPYPYPSLCGECDFPVL